MLQSRPDNLILLPTIPDLDTNILPQIVAASVTEETFKLTSPDGMRLNVYGWSGEAVPDKVVVVVHGMGGHSGYYSTSLAPYLVPSGVVLYAPDLRGHGHSEGKRGDISTFDFFQQDVETVMCWARLRHPALPLFLLGESMGTCIAIICAATASAAVRPDGLVLAACVIAPTVKPRADEIVRTLWYASRNRQKVALPITGREEQGVRDLAFVQVLKSDVLFNRHVSVRFLTSMTRHMNRAARLPQALHLPVLLLQGGHDFTIRFRPTRSFFKRIAVADKEMHIFPNAYHAILNDPDSPQVRAKIIEWLNRQTLHLQSK